MSRRILFLNNGGKLGGAEHSLLGLLARLDRERYLPALVCPPGGDLAHRARATGVKVFEMPMVALNVMRSPGAYARGLAALGRLIATWRPAIIHGNGLRSLHYVVPLGRLARTPVVVHVRDMLIPPSRLTRALLRAVDAQIAISQAVVAILDSHALRSSYCTVIYNGVDPTAFLAAAAARSATRAGLGLGDDHVAIGLIGRLLPSKGLLTAVEAAGLLAADLHLRWLIAGEEWSAAETGVLETTGFASRLRERAAELGVADRVVLLGARDDIPELMAAIDLVAIPSLVPEGLGRVAIEALAAGTPVVVSDAGGLSEIVADGEVGYRVPPGDAAALAARVATLADDPALRHRFGARGKALVAERFSLDAYVRGVSAVYETLLA